MEENIMPHTTKELMEALAKELENMKKSKPPGPKQLQAPLLSKELLHRIVGLVEKHPSLLKNTDVFEFLEILIGSVEPTRNSGRRSPEGSPEEMGYTKFENKR